MLPAASTVTTATTLRLPQFFPTMISRAMAAAISTRKAPSTTAAGNQPVRPDTAIATRPATHVATSTKSGAPWIGRRPVQLGIAVRRNPVITAGR